MMSSESVRVQFICRDALCDNGRVFNSLRLDNYEKLEKRIRIYSETSLDFLVFRIYTPIMYKL